MKIEYEYGDIVEIMDDSSIPLAACTVTLKDKIGKGNWKVINTGGWPGTEGESAIIHESNFIPK